MNIRHAKLAMGTVAGISLSCSLIAAAPATELPPAGGIPAAEMPASQGGYHLKLVKTIDLPGQSTEGDVVAADPGANKVYLSQRGADAVVIIDAKRNQVEARVTGIPDVYGVTFGPKYVYAASTGDNAVYVISKDTWKIIKKVDAGGKGADGIVYDAKDNTVAVVNDSTNNMQFINADMPFNAIANVKLQPANPVAGPDLPVYVPQKDTVYAPDDNYINVVNAKTHAVDHVWKYPDVPVDSKNQLKGMYYDAKKNILWVATTGQKVLAVNADTGKEVAAVKTTTGQDQIVGDPQKRLLYLGEGESGGGLGVVNMDTMQSLPDAFPGGKNAEVHTQDVMPTTGYLYAYGSKANQVYVLDIQRRRAR